MEPTGIPDGEDGVLSLNEPSQLQSPETEEQNSDRWGTDSPEYLAFMTHFDDLATSLSTLNLTVFSSQVFSKSLISSIALQSVVTDLPARQRAETLLTSVQERIQSNPQSLHTFIQTLRHFHPASCDTIAGQLETSVQMYQIFLSLQVMNTQSLDLDQLALKLLETKLITKDEYDNCALQTEAMEKAGGLYHYMLEQGMAKPFLDILEQFSNTKQLAEKLKRGESPSSVTSGYATVSASEFEIPPMDEVSVHDDATNNVTRKSSSTDTFHSFNSDNGVAFYHSRDFTSEAFAPVMSRQLLWKHSSGQPAATMPTVSPFSSVADVPSNSTIVECVQEVSL